MSISRRSFIALAGATGIAAVAAPLILRSEKDLVIGMLRKELPELHMDSENLSHFAEGFLKYYKSERMLRRKTTLTSARMIDILPTALSRKFVPSPVKSAIEFLRSELFNAFFLGTDYLDVYETPERKISFFFIPDPYQVGCSNRLAKYDSQV